MINLKTNEAMELQIEINKYFDMVDNAALIFYEAVKNYVKNKMNSFARHYQKITTLETQADELRREIKYKLYSFKVMSDIRGDVLGLLENMDNVLDLTEKVVELFSIEKPIIPDFLKEQFLLLAETSSLAVSALVKAARAFFEELDLINRYINKVHFFEQHADKIEEDIKRKVFKSDEVPEISRKMHIRDFTEKIAEVSDIAQSVAERLSVYSIKRNN